MRSRDIAVWNYYSIINIRTPDDARLLICTIILCIVHTSRAIDSLKLLFGHSTQYALKQRQYTAVKSSDSSRNSATYYTPRTELYTAVRVENRNGTRAMNILTCLLFVEWDNAWVQARYPTVIELCWRLKFYRSPCNRQRRGKQMFVGSAVEINYII